MRAGGRVLVLTSVVISDNLVLDRLHEGDELVERNLGAQLCDVLLNFVRIALETAHDSFKVVGVDEAALLLVEEVEDFLQICDLVLGEAVLLFVVG